MRRVAEIQIDRGEIVNSYPRPLTRREQYPDVAADVHGPVLVSDLSVTEPGVECVDSGFVAQKSHHHVGTAAD
jgi:hypothetical protein